MTTSGLRERKKADTRRALSDAALTLAFERGVDDVTREAIAGLAGVSLRTFNNYFSNKYEALAYRQTERLRRSIDTLRERPADEALWTSLTEAMVATLQEDIGEAADGGDGVPNRAQLVEVRKMLMRPEIRNATMPGKLFDEMVSVIAERSGTDVRRDLYPRLVSGVMRAVADAAFDAYAVADPPASIADLLRQGMAAVAAGLPEPSPKDGRRG